MCVLKQLDDQQTPGSRAFTLIELLLVFSVMALIAGMVLSGFQHSIESQRITDSITRLAGDLRYASQLAVKDGRTIYLVFDKRVDLTSPLSTEQYRGYMLCTEPSSIAQAEITALREYTKFNFGVIASSDDKLSSLLAAKQEIGTLIAVGFRPDGSTTLSKTEGAFPSLTLVEEKTLLEEGYEGIPKNSRTLLINPFTSRVIVY
jgi:uncharacterized protein (TIGR02596 family)